jgi:DNA-binding response OmpR family regulator
MADDVQVLIVDDDAAVSRVLARAFERAGYIALMAKDGARALEVIESTPVDALICDIHMPRLDGRSLCHQLWQEGPYLPRSVIVVTSRTGIEERAWLDEFPGVDLVEKPVSPRDLVRRVDAAIRPPSHEEAA